MRKFVLREWRYRQERVVCCELIITTLASQTVLLLGDRFCIPFIWVCFGLWLYMMHMFRYICGDIEILEINIPRVTWKHSRVS